MQAALTVRQAASSTNRPESPGSPKCSARRLAATALTARLKEASTTDGRRVGWAGSGTESLSVLAVLEERGKPPSGATAWPFLPRRRSRNCTQGYLKGKGKAEPKSMTIG